MTRLRPAERTSLVLLLLVFAVGAVFCIIAVFHDVATFFRAWLLAYLFWLGLPLCGVTLVLVHDLTGGEWMETARPALGIWLRAGRATPDATSLGERGSSPNRVRLSKSVGPRP